MSVWVDSIRVMLEGGYGRVCVDEFNPRFVGSFQCGWTQSKVCRVMSVRVD